jgi:mannose-P-dolichol utilization defect 1
MDRLQTIVLDPLKPYLKPAVSALPKPVHETIISLIGSPCHSALLLDLDVTKDPECTSLAISKGLGIAIVGTSAIVKVPQILKLVNSRSASGVSFASYALETASLLITIAYNVRQQFPFSTFGESGLIAVQDVIVAILVLLYSGKPAVAATFVAVVAASIYALFDQTLVDAQTLTYLQTGAGILGIGSKIPQIYTIWQEGSTGQLSAFAVRVPVNGRCLISPPSLQYPTNHQWTVFCRCSTISSALCLAFTPPFRRLMISSSCTATSPHSRSMLS